MNYLIYKLCFRQFFLNPEGIKLFADRCVNKYVSKAAVHKADVLTTYVTVLKEEQAKRRLEFIECEKSDRMDYGNFELKRKRSRQMKIIVYTTIIFEIFLNYVSTLIFIQGDGLLYILVRWFLSIGLTLLTMLSMDALLRNLLPEGSVIVKGTQSQQEDIELDNKNNIRKRIIGFIISSICLIAFEIAIIGVTKARALDIEGGRSSGDFLFYGFILLSMALPVIAGYFKWDSEHHGKLYQNTLIYNKTQKLLHILNLIITSNMKEVKGVVENSIRKSWEVFSRFKLYKENFNNEKGIPKEDISKHYSNNSESFKDEALSHFGNEVKAILKELELQQTQKNKY